jgi:hypothetical protein
MTDRSLATVLFTDIVGSTERAGQLGDCAWQELLACHHERVRRELRRHGGREVTTAGDGFLAVFEQPALQGRRRPHSLCDGRLGRRRTIPRRGGALVSADRLPVGAESACVRRRRDQPLHRLLRLDVLSIRNRAGAGRRNDLVTHALTRQGPRSLELARDSPGGVEEELCLRARKRSIMISLRQPVTDRDHALGPPDAPVMLVEYGDFACPYCGRAYPLMERLVEECGDSLGYVFRHYPINLGSEHAPTRRRGLRSRLRAGALLGNG